MRYSRTALAVVTGLLILVVLIVPGCSDSGKSDSAVNTGGSGISVLFFTQPG